MDSSHDTLAATRTSHTDDAPRHGILRPWPVPCDPVAGPTGLDDRLRSLQDAWAHEDDPHPSLTDEVTHDGALEVDTWESDENRARQDLFQAVLAAVEACRPEITAPDRNTDASWIAWGAGAFGEWGLLQAHDGSIRVEVRVDGGDARVTAALLDVAGGIRQHWSRATGVALEVDRPSDHRRSRIAAHHPPVDLLTMSEEARVELVVWAVRTVVAMHDTMDEALRHHAHVLWMARSA